MKQHDRLCVLYRWTCRTAKMSNPKSVTLEETVAEDAAQLLIDAADARQLATTKGVRQEITDSLLRYASTLENGAMKWEQRLRWWRRLRQRKSAAHQ